MSGWNHRVVDMSSTEEPCLGFREVYYDQAGTPAAHGEPFMVGDSLEELQELVSRLRAALDLPILRENDFTGHLSVAAAPAAPQRLGADPR
jgi:hypothetical protein